MADHVTNRGAYRMARGDLLWLSDTFRMLLLKSSWAPTAQQIRDLNVVDDLVPGTNEISVSGYSRQTLANKTITDKNNPLRIATKNTFTRRFQSPSSTKFGFARLCTINDDD